MPSRSEDSKSAPPEHRVRYQVGQQDLPLHCPLPRLSLWDSHPRVYLPIEADGYAKCPYCGTEFVLRKEE